METLLIIFCILVLAIIIYVFRAKNNKQKVAEPHVIVEDIQNLDEINSNESFEVEEAIAAPVEVVTEAAAAEEEEEEEVKEESSVNDAPQEIVPEFEKQENGLSFVAIDFETATPNRNSACQLGIVLVENGNIKEKKCFLIQPPENEYNRMNTAVHGLSAKDTLNMPTFKELWHDIREYLNDRLIVCHNADFDISVLKNTCESYSIKDLSIQEVKCTYRMTGLALIEACQGLNVTVNGHHDALNDAEMCAQIFIKLSNGEVVDTSLIKVTKGGKKEHDEAVVNKAFEIESSYFKGKATVITGVFGKFSRDDIKDILEHHGAIIKGSISSKTEIVVMGMDAGPAKCSKIKELQDKGVNIVVLNEQELLEKLKL